MQICRKHLLLYLLLVLILVTGGPVGAQFIQGSDHGSTTEFTDPATWTRTIINKTVQSTVTFDLNPCEWVLYLDSNGAPHSCMPRPVDCSKLSGMETKLVDALDVWNALAPGEFPLQFGQIVGGSCLTTVQECIDLGAQGLDIWSDDGDWVVTRTYKVQGPLDPVACPMPPGDPGVPRASSGGNGLRLYTDPTGNDDERWVRECDIVFFEEEWDNTVQACFDEGYTQPECGGAWQIALAHEIGHCLGFSHSYLTRKTLRPLKNTFSAQGLELRDTKPSVMSYDRVGSIDLGGPLGVLGPYDEALYLYPYAANPDPGDTHFAAFGTVTECVSGQPLFGAAVFALEVDPNQTNALTPVQMSLSGEDLLKDETGEFRLEHLGRGRSYRLLVVDTRNINYMVTVGWNFDDQTPIATPGLPVFKTDEWDEDHAGVLYKYETSARFATGLVPKLTDLPFVGPLEGDYDAQNICVELE